MVSVDKDAVESTHLVDSLVADPSGKTALGDEATFSMIMREIAEEMAPRLFAVFQEYGERVDMHLAAWGFAFDGRTQVVSTDGSMVLRDGGVDDVLRAFNLGSRLRARLVWFGKAPVVE